MQQKKRMLTLLEVLIAITLLFSFATVVSVQTYRWIQQGRYTSDVRRVASLLNTAQNMALGQKGHVQVIFSHENNTITIHCQPEVACPKAFYEKFVHKKIPLKTIRTIFHNGKNLSPDETWTIKFNRYDGAFRMSGTFAFSPKNHAKEEDCLYKIVLKTYPSPIFPITTLPPESKENLSHRLYPTWILNEVTT